MKRAISIAAVLIILIIQPSIVSGDYWYGDFLDNTTSVFTEDAAMYSAPDINSSVTVLIPIGTEVEISGSAGEDIFTNGTPSYWYSVKCTLNDMEYSGFMPGLYLAMSSLELGIDTLFLFNVTGYAQEDDRFTASARIVVSGEITAELEFLATGNGFGPVPYSYCIRGTELSNEGLAGMRNLIELSFIYEACGYLNRDVLFACTDDKFIMGPEAYSLFEAGIFHFNETFITPSDSSGISDEVIVLTSTEEWDETIGEYVETESSHLIYYWNGSEFTPFAEQ